ncbi:MAG: hypothetical protein FWD67_02930 [Betaproteobacteria bacterium]|nr:hypothetical protein [Betaproteobacteria bacterium]
MVIRLFSQISFIFILSINGFAHAADPLTVHVFVALADNKHQGIVPIPSALGNGDNPAKNLYWGAAYGMKTFFGKKSSAWKLEYCRNAVSSSVLERCVFSTRDRPHAYLVADAYRGQEIGDAMADFMSSAAGKLALDESNSQHHPAIHIQAPNSAMLSIYVGHNGLMDAPLQAVALIFPAGIAQGRQAVVLACKSQAYFADYLNRSGAQSLVMTYDFMAPEAYVVEGIVEGRRHNESAENIRIRAAKAYAQYQRISENLARRIFGAPKL